MRKYCEKVIKMITNILLFFVIVAAFFVCYNFVQLKVLRNDYTNILGYSFFEVATGSMSGTLEIGDIIIVKIDSDYKEDDIITYKSGNEFITHRILEINENNLVTKGDANNTEDRTVTPSMVLGKVVHVIPGVGVWKKVLMTPSVLFTILVTLVLFSLAFSYKKTETQEEIKEVKESSKRKKIKLPQINKTPKKKNTDYKFHTVKINKIDLEAALEKEEKEFSKIKVDNISIKEKEKKKAIKEAELLEEYTRELHLEDIKTKKKKNIDKIELLDDATRKIKVKDSKEKKKASSEIEMLDDWTREFKLEDFHEKKSSSEIEMLDDWTREMKLEDIVKGKENNV